MANEYHYPDYCYDLRVDYLPARIGRWEIRVDDLSEQDVASYNLVSRAQAAMGRGNGEPREIPPGIYRRLIRHDPGYPVTVMSDTPAEIFDMAGPYLGQTYRPTPRMLINGLGLGILPLALLTYSSIEHIDIVEIDIEVIGLVGQRFFDDPRVTIHHADAFTMEWPKGTTWDYAWHDVWDELSADHVKAMDKLHRKYRKVVGDQDSWCRREMMADARHWGIVR